ncbi:MAG: excinuclease ABC subunit UvrC [Candidatus Poseidoniaceae archaeon]|nr:excinuclease ABC subunit UvrC [Candidatus Poseidoniaceae archaeon]
MPVHHSSVDLPASPGVYLFKNEHKIVLYVGKATCLKERVRAYFSNNPDRIMIPELVRRADSIEYIVTNSPSDALILERQLIREHKPRYNSRLKDDKSYPYLILTDEEFPRIMYTRQPPKKCRIWGPFPNVGAAKQVMQLLRSQFGIRDKDCRGEDGCLAMHIGLCQGPCIDPEGYPEKVKIVTNILDGKATELIEELIFSMDRHSEKEEYELAAKYRDMIRAVRSVTSQRMISSTVYRDCDSIGIAVKGELAAVVVIHANGGVVRGQEVWPLVHRGDISESISIFVSEHYSNRLPPKLILTPIPLPPTVTNWLNIRKGVSVKNHVPKRGDLAKLTTLAKRNAEIQIETISRKTSGSLEQRAADEAAVLLGMDSLNHIVCFDMAQLVGDARVGASISLRNGRPAKKEYRTYTVKGKAIDDLRMMSEVVERWLKRIEEYPDLLLIDGGKTHLTLIANLLQEHGLENEFQLASLSKREETIHRVGKEDLVLDKKGRALVHARDEAHRFVNKFHRKVRSRTRLSDPLENIEGLGAKKLQSLLRHFGGKQGIKHASVEDLKTVPGIGNSLAIRIHKMIQE